MTIVELDFSIYSNNIRSLISIYYDSERIRAQKTRELEEGLKISTWTAEEFDEYSHYLFHFDWLLIQSLFISAFSYFENYMHAVAILIEKERGYKIKLNDIKGVGILDAYRKYTYLIGDIQAAGANRLEWKAILEFKEIRNAVVHKYGEIKRSITKATEHGIYYGPSKKLVRIKDVKFLEDFVTVAISYMKLISNELIEKNYGAMKPPPEHG